jgi:transposase
VEVRHGSFLTAEATRTACGGEVLPPRSPGKAVHRASASAGQEAFFEGHVHALNVLGGVPTGKVRYDNLRAAVAQVLGLSRRRVEAERWTAFRSHYGIDALYCQPGIRGAHEKRRR